MANFEGYQGTRRLHWDNVAKKLDTWTSWGGSYHQRLTQIYKYLIPGGQRVLEIGCGRGDLLAALQPVEGVGIDFSDEMIYRARQRHPEIKFILSDAHDLSTLNQSFDYILLSDLVNDVWDVQTVLEQIVRVSHSRTRVIINNYNRLWEFPLAIAEWLGLAKPTIRQNWLAPQDIINLLDITQFETIRQWSEILFPLQIPLISNFLNKFLVRFWPFNHLGLTSFILARPQYGFEVADFQPHVSVIIPARNEAGNIPQIFKQMPEMGAGVELVFVEGHSSDETYSVIEQQIAEHPERRCQLHRQTGIGKGDAVRLGFASATGDIVMIYDADLTVPFESMTRFYRALLLGRGEFINGVRLVYPIEEDAMRLFNHWGNKFFSLVFSWLLGQPIKDTLCGTKVLWKADYELIAANRNYFGDFDPFGDYDLIFGAAKLGLKIIDLPIRYQARTYGTTNIQRWKHGWLLLRMVSFAADRIKFV